MTEPKGYTHVHGAWFQVEATHGEKSWCSWCRKAQDVAEAHVKDATLKTAKYTVNDHRDQPHSVKLTRIPGNLNPQTDSFVKFHVGPLPKYAAGGHVTLPQPDIDMSDAGLSRYAAKPTATLNELKLIYEVTNLRIKLKRQRPVVLDLDESEARLVLLLLELEQEAKDDDAEGHYQNGDGFEGECVQARTESREAEKLADRLRKLIGKHLDKAYAGELES